MGGCYVVWILCCFDFASVFKFIFDNSHITIDKNVDFGPDEKLNKLNDI